MNRHLLRMLALICMLVVPASAGVTHAQEADSAFASGLDEPATRFSSDGDPVLEMQVTGIEPDWQDYGQYEEPEEGKQYARISVQLTNLIPAEQEILPSFFTVYDSMGFPGELSSFNEVEDLWENTDDVVLAPDETIDGSMVFAMNAGETVTWVTYFPSSPQVLIYLGDTGTSAATAMGFNQPTTYYGDDRAMILELQVTGIEADWQDFGSMAPQPGQMYVKVDLQVTNRSDDPVDLMPYFVGARDTTGKSLGIMNVGVDLWSVEAIPLEPGKTVDGSMIFAANTDAEVVFVSYQSFSIASIYLGDQP